MKKFRAADKSHAGGDEKHDINFHWPYCRSRVSQGRISGGPAWFPYKCKMKFSNIGQNSGAQH